jgi:hypothetical protein
MNFKHLFRQDLQDYYDIFAFPEERQKPNCPTDEAFVTVEGGLRLLRVPWGLSKKQVNPVNPVRPNLSSLR